MSALVERFGPAPKAFLAVPLVGAFFIDFINAVIITLCLNLWSYQPVVQVQLHSTGDASPPHPTAHKPRGGGPGPAALLLVQICRIFSLVAPCQLGASPVSVRRWTCTTGC